MKKYLDKKTEHLREVAKVRTLSFDPKEVDKIFDQLKSEVLLNFFRSFAQNLGAKFEKYTIGEPNGEFVHIGMYFGKNYISNYKLYPFHVEVDSCFDMKLANEHLAEVEAAALENPHVLFKMATPGNTEFYASKPASFFTQNYADAPYINKRSKRKI